MNISIFGLGYVGCVGMGCLAKMGHTITGVDINGHKVALINSRLPTIIEKDIDELIKQGVAAGNIRATQNAEEAIANTDLSFICVGTPNGIHGHLDLTFLRKVAKEIAYGIAKKDGFHVVVIRSTVLPGTNEEISLLIADTTHKRIDEDFCVLSNPEFLREGSAVSDFFNPSVTVIGGTSQQGINILTELYSTLPGAVEIVDIHVAETIKLLNNSFHALKVAFANEVGAICKATGINTYQLFDIFLKDTSLNISTAYLRPGFAYGGSCLPKDLKALQLISHDNYQATPILNSIDKSNQGQIDRAFTMIKRHNLKRIGIWGITFKEGTDDMRNSPIINVVENLLGKGYEVIIYDENVSESLLIGANKEFIEKKLPHFSKLLYNSFDTFISKCNLLVVNTKGSANQYNAIKKCVDLKLLDLKYIKQLMKHPGYEGFNW